MIVVDSVLLFPMKGLLWLAGKINESVAQDTKDQITEVKNRLSEIYLLVETGQMSEEEFDKQESQLLEKLDELEGSSD